MGVPVLVVVGGSGFVGTRLCKRLVESCTPFEILDKRISSAFEDRSSKLNICDLDRLLSHEPDGKPEVIVNLAAEHRDDVKPVSLYDKVNVDAALNVCEFANCQGVKKIVFTSSVAVYGFAERETDESGAINPFNDYGRTKYEAEQVYKEWQEADPENRSLTIIRPTVVFGEQNRGNVFNLLRQIASGRFVMVGNGKNRKSMAYVENVAAFIQHNFKNPPGIHIYNYIDKPDFDMNSLVRRVEKALGVKPKVGFRLPYFVGLLAGYGFDLAAKVTGRPLPISSIRVKKFCKESTYNTALAETGFVPPVELNEAIDRTIKYEFVDKVEGEVFYTE